MYSRDMFTQAGVWDNLEAVQFCKTLIDKAAQCKGIEWKTAIFKRSLYRPGSPSVYRDWALIMATNDPETAEVSGAVLKNSQGAQPTRGILTQTLDHLDQVGTIYENGAIDLMLRFPLSERSLAIDRALNNPTLSG